MELEHHLELRRIIKMCSIYYLMLDLHTDQCKKLNIFKESYGHMGRGNKAEIQVADSFPYSRARHISLTV